VSPKFSNGIHHVAIICSNYEISKHFYSSILGFEVIHEVFREERKSWKLNLKVNELTQIELFSFPDPPKRVSRPEACGLRHLAFRVKSVDRVISWLLSQNVEVESVRVDEYTDRRFTFFQDPDGLPLEIYEEAH
jgi:glyoxylase I family protein